MINLHVRSNDSVQGFELKDLKLTLLRLSIPGEIEHETMANMVKAVKVLLLLLVAILK